MNDIQYEVARQFAQVLGYTCGTVFWIYLFRVLFGKE